MKQRRGIAMILAIFSIGLVGLTLGVIGGAATMQIRRTESAAQDAQLRQLLLAGAIIAESRLNAGMAMDAPVTLPKELREVQATLMLRAENDQRIEITARIGNRSMSQEVQFRQGTGRWHMIAAYLR